MKSEINKALWVLQNGGTILYPTDTIWGIGCDATNFEAVARIYKIKKRSEKKALILLAEDTNMISKYTNSKQLSACAKKQPTTIIYQNVKGLPHNLIGEDNTAGFRIPNDPFCKRLLTRFKLPIVSTSANISNEACANKFSEISKEIKNNVDYIVNLRQEEIMNTPSSIFFINPDGTVKKIR